MHTYTNKHTRIYMIYIRCHNLSKNNKDFLQIFSIAKYIPKTTGHNIFASCYLSNKLKSFLTSFFFFFLSEISFYCYFIHRIRVQEVPSRVAEKLALFSSFFFFEIYPPLPSFFLYSLSTSRSGRGNEKFQ